MASYIIYAVLMGIQSVGFVGTFSFKKGSKMFEFTNAMTNMVDRNSKTISSTGPIDCIAKCMYKAKCYFYNSNYVPQDFISGGKNYKCILFNKDENSTVERDILNTCEKKSDHIVLYPKKIAGACSDHTCPEGKKCSPRKEGGYKCVRESGSHG